MAKIIAIGRNPRVFERRLVTDDGGASCCCETRELVFLVFTCCDLIPKFAVTRRVRDELFERCGDRWPSDRANLFKRRGSNECLKFPNPYTDGVEYASLWRDEAEEAGFEIIDNADLFTCVATDSPNPIYNRCYATGTDCPPCPRLCCLKRTWAKKCGEPNNPFPDPPVQGPSETLCCLYGRVADRKWYYRRQDETVQYFWPLNAVGSTDPWCPSGCYTELFAARFKRVTTYEETMRFSRCNSDLEWDFTQTCLGARGYESSESVSRVYGFTDRTLPSCLSYRDTFDNPDDIFTNECTNRNLVPIPNRINRYQRTNSDGLPCWWYTLDTGPGLPEDKFCGSSVSSRCTIRLGEYFVTQQVTYRYNVTCKQGLYFVLIDEEWRWAPDGIVPEGCEAIRGSLFRKTRTQIENNYDIRVVARDGCNESECDGYAREGGTPTLPGPPPVNPDEGAFLFL